MVDTREIEAEFAALNGTCASWWTEYADALEIAACDALDADEMNENLTAMIEAGWFGTVH